MREFGFQWHITNLCNLRCKHCYQDDFTSQRDLDWQGLKSVCDNITSFLEGSKKVTHINITGGEPLLKKELFPLLEYLEGNDRVKELTIITNATLFDRAIIDGLNRFSKLKTIKASFDGLREVNDSLREDGVFDKIGSAIDLLKRFGNFKIVAMFTILKRNMLEMPLVFDFCKENKLGGLIIERFIPLGKGAGIKNDVLDYRDWRESVALISDYCGIPFEENEENLLAYRAFWINFVPEKISLRGAFCNVGDDALCIMPNGDVYPCRRFNLPVGNLLKNSLKDILESAALLKDVHQKKNLKGRCRDCRIKYCIGCRALSFALSGDYLSEDIQCWYKR